MEIRGERPEEAEAIRTLTEAAFAPMPYSDGTEHALVGALRDAGALAVSLVATEEGRLVGHVAFSPVTVDGRDVGWFGLGPISVEPTLQDRGIGSALVRAGIERLRRLGAGGCVLVGAPGYYGRFGFETDPRLTYAGAPASVFQGLVLRDPMPEGAVRFHPAFGG